MDKKESLWIMAVIALLGQHNPRMPVSGKAIAQQAVVGADEIVSAAKSRGVLS